jgi:hypothetical protein
MDKRKFPIPAIGDVGGSVEQGWWCKGRRQFLTVRAMETATGSLTVDTSPVVFIKATFQTFRQISFAAA